ncbi:MAG: hypothetical protein LUF35_01110 [Lachnospiraceae bacterium]|nr:hypothetical protein [Lachnospiraceae bacterium]
MAKEPEKKLQETDCPVSMEENGSAGGKNVAAAPEKKISETWAEDTIADLDEFIESQGIYIRQ